MKQAKKRIQRNHIIILCLCSLFFFQACSIKEEKITSYKKLYPAVEKKEKAYAPITISPKELQGKKERDLTIPFGSTLQIRLPYKPSTGYSWFSEQSTNLLKQLGERFDNKNPKRLGQDAEQILIFHASKEGETTLTLEYKRPWEKKTPPSEIYLYNIRVTEE